MCFNFSDTIHTELLETEDGSLSAKVVLKIGPIKAKFKGKVLLDLSSGPTKYSLSGEGDGGVAGFAKGGADVELVQDGNETILKYIAKSEVKGKIAQLGSRLILSTAKKLSKSFFENFKYAENWAHSANSSKILLFTFTPSQNFAIRRQFKILT
mgnify:CR=1 FL=1